MPTASRVGGYYPVCVLEGYKSHLEGYVKKEELSPVLNLWPGKWCLIGMAGRAFQMGENLIENLRL